MAISSGSKASPQPCRRGWRRWFQFGISSLLLLTLGVAIFCAWLRSERAHQERKPALLKRLVEAGGKYEASAMYPGWVQWLIGTKCLGVKSLELSDPTSGWRPPSVQDELNQRLLTDLKWTWGLPELESLTLPAWPPLDAASLQPLTRLRQLRKLSLCAIASPALWAMMDQLSHVTDIRLTVQGAIPSLAQHPGLRNLTELHLRWLNAAEPIDIRGFPKLISLEVGGIDCANSVTVADLPELTTFRVCHDYCNFLPYRRVGELPHTMISTADRGGQDNRITLMRLPKLQKCALMGPMLAVDIDDAPLLRSLQADNFVESADGTRFISPASMRVRGCGAVNTLYLANVELTPATFDQFGQLKTLTVFDFGRGFQRLELRHLPVLATVEAHFAQCDEFVIDDAPALTQLTVVNGALLKSEWPSTKPSPMPAPTQMELHSAPRLESVKLEHVELKDTDWLAHAADLSSLTLGCHAEPGTSLQLRHLKKLQHANLNVSGQWAEISLEDLPALERLEIDTRGSQGGEVTLRQLPKLSKLDLLRLVTIDELILDDLPLIESIFAQGLPNSVAPSVTPVKATSASIQCSSALPNLPRARLEARGLPAVYFVNLGHFDVTPASWPEFKRLKYLWLFNCSEPRLAPRQWSQVESLYLANCDLSWRMLGAIFSPAVKKK